MALTATTLAAAITATQREFALTSGTSVTVDYLLQVNDEVMLVTAIAGAWVTVERGYLGTLARPHGILSRVVHGAPHDFPLALPDRAVRLRTYGVSGALIVEPGTHVIRKATAAAMTLTPPNAADEGLRMLIVAATAAAHTITLSSGTFNNAVLETRIVLGGAIGDWVEIMAVNGAWVTLFSKNATIPSTSASSSASASISPSASTSPSSSASSSAS